MQNHICRRIFLEDGTSISQKQFSEQKATEFSERYRQIPVLFTPKCIHRFIAICDRQEEWPEDEGEETMACIAEICTALEASRRIESQHASNAPESPASASLEVIQPEQPDKNLNTEELILRGATEASLANGAYQKLSEVFTFDEGMTEIREKDGAIVTPEHDGMLLGLGNNLGKIGVWLCIQGAQRLIAKGHSIAFEQACDSLKIAPSTLYNYLRCLPNVTPEIKKSLPITVIAEICTAKYSDDKAENDQAKNELLREALAGGWSAAEARSHSKMRRGHDEEITDGTRKPAKDRIAELESALQGLLDCISETKGEEAFEAVIRAKTLLGIVTEGVPT
jgi:hypothetical protein